jgi:polysaccharide export outer membrane protein
MEGDNHDGFPLDLVRAPLRSSGNRVGVGDQLTVTIFEAGQGGLFSNGTGNGTVTIPRIAIGPDGIITLPYAGQIMVRDLTPIEVEERIVAALTGQAIEPQAVVTVTQDLTNSVTVTGDVHHPTRVPLSLRGERLSHALVAAGGSRYPAHETQVTLTRNGRSSSASLERALTDPTQNVALRSGDVITVLRRSASYTIVGAVSRPSDVPFNGANVTLMEAIGQSAGLLDARADPSGVFLFRREDAMTLRSNGILEKGWWASEPMGIPTIYQLDLHQPQALFLAQSVQLRDGDMIYVANAGSVQTTKILRLFGLTSMTARDAVSVAN